MKCWVVGLAVVAVAIRIGDRELHADVCYYVGPDGGSWHVPENWSCGYVPIGGLTSEVRIINGLTVRISADTPAVPTVAVGYMRDGTIIQDNGTLAPTGLFIGREEGGENYKGTFVLNDGEVLGSVMLGGSVRDNSFVMNGGSMSLKDLYVGQSAGDNTFLMNGGELNVQLSLHVAHWPWGFADKLGVFTQTGGTVVVEGPLIMGAGPEMGESTATYYLDGGTLTAREIGFGSTDISYFDFRGGTLNLPGNWNFDRLVGILYSDFRVFGNPVAAEDLTFPLVVIDDQVYTQISIIPEPSALILLGMGALVFTIGWRRRTRAKTDRA